MQRLPTFAWVGTTERYQESLALLAYTFGWLPTRMNKRLNVTPKRPRLEQLVPHLRDQIAAVCQLDQRLYRYTTELFEQRFMAMCLDLLERYGDREHAHLKLPLAHDVLLELLDRHFIHCATTSASPARGTTGRIDQPFEGDGWHHLEYTPTSEAYRWSGPTNESELVLLLTPGHAYHLSVRIIHALSLDTLHSLRISANQAELASTLQNEPDGAHRITAIIPATSEPMVRIRFQVDQAIKPSVGDDRTLGLAFGVLSVEPIGEAYATTG
jgi:hypothetical protein